MNKFQPRRQLKLMAEVQCWAIWDISASDNIDPATLPLSDKLIDELNEWSDRFDSIYKLDDPNFHLNIEFASMQEEEAFYDDGWLLLKKLREEMPDVDWWYRDQRCSVLLRARPVVCL